MKVLSSTTANKALSGGGMEDSVIDLQVNALHDNGSVPSLQCKTESPIEHDGGKKGLFSKLMRRDTQTNISTRPGHKTSQLFGQPLPDDAKIPKPIAELLGLLWRKGPDTEGVFRKVCNSKNLNAVRDQLNSGVPVDLEALPVTLLVGLLKMFLRELPGSLLVAERYSEWIKALEREEERCAELRRIVSKLPEANRVLLQNLLCLLHHIIQRTEKNKMDSNNLAICIGPTLLQLSNQPPDMATIEKVTNLTKFLIDNCCEILGENILTLLGDPEEMLQTSDTKSSNQHDSAYDSTDGENGEATGHTQQECPDIQIQCSVNHSHSSDNIFETFAKPFDRRSSEPTIFSLAGVKDQFLARSHDDCSSAKEYEEQMLKKQNSDDSFLQAQRTNLPSMLRKATTSLNLEVPAFTKASSYSSCSLESTNSNTSETSVFVNSPEPSPSSPRKIQPERHTSLNMKSKTDTNSRRPFTFKRAKSLGSFSINRGSGKKTEAQKEGTFPCGTLQEDSQNEAELPDEPTRRQRPLSAIEVFDHVDRRDPGCPPSYQQALISGVLPAPPEYRSMTVHRARELGQRSRPISMNDCILDTSPVSQLLEKFNFSCESLVAPQQSTFRQRAMSESIGCTRIEKNNHRCSQPVFEEVSYAKESYV